MATKVTDLTELATTADNADFLHIIDTSDTTGGAAGTSKKVLISNLPSGGGGGSGTVTSIIAGTGLDGGTITTSGTIDLANTAVSAGSYTSADITIDAQGRITAAANGSGAASVSYMTKGDVNPCGAFNHATSYKNITLTANRFYGIPFKVVGELSVTHIGMQTGAGASGVAHDIVGGIYKYVYASDSWTKVVQVGPFTQSVDGKQSIALGSTETLSDGIYLMAMHSDGAQTNVTGYYAQYLQNILTGYQGGSVNRNAYFLYKDFTYAATLPASFPSGDLLPYEYTGLVAASCYLTLA